MEGLNVLPETLLRRQSFAQPATDVLSVRYLLKHKDTQSRKNDDTNPRYAVPHFRGGLPLRKKTLGLDGATPTVG